MPEPTAHDQAMRYIALKQQSMDLTTGVGSEVPAAEKTDSTSEMMTDNNEGDREEQKAGPIQSPNQPPQQNTTPPPMHNSQASGAYTSSSMPPPPPPLFNFGSFGNREWGRPSSSGHSARPPLPPSYPSSHSHHHHHLHAPRPAHPYESVGSRMRGDGFLLDAEDEVEGLDLSNSSESDMQLQRAASATNDENELEQERIFGMPMLGETTERPRSAGPSYAPIASTMSRASTGDSTSAPLQLVCPSCGERPPGADAEQSFHAHVSRCFVSQLTASPGRPPRSQLPAGSPIDNSGGPIRKTRSRAASAAAATGSAAELASSLANQQIPTTPESHGYHPYSNPNLSDALRQLRRTVDQLDVHQRISIMEAFHRLSRAAMTEHHAAAAAASAAQTPRSKGKALRSATNSPSPKHKPMEDKVCNNIMSLLYSPRITAPHPSPSGQMSGLHIGVPSPLAIGQSMDTRSHLTRTAPSILSSPVAAMDTLELGAVHSPTHTPKPKQYLFAPDSAADEVDGGILASPIDDSGVFSPNSIMVTDADGSESEVGAGALALTGAFGHGLSSSSDSSSAPGSEQTSPNAPSETFSADRASNLITVFPVHCFPDVAAIAMANAARDRPMTMQA